MSEELAKARIKTMDKKILDARIKTMNLNERTWLEKYGWYSDMLYGYEHGLVNFHTHGLWENYDYPDFQIVVPLSPEKAQTIFSGLVNRVKNGERFNDSDFVSGVFEDCLVVMNGEDEDDRLVFRILIPDNNGYFPFDDECDEKYKLQWDFRT